MLAGHAQRRLLFGARPPPPSVFCVVNACLTVAPFGRTVVQLFASGSSTDIRYMPDDETAGAMIAEAVLDGIRYE